MVKTRHGINSAFSASKQFFKSWFIMCFTSNVIYSNIVQFLQQFFNFNKCNLYLDLIQIRKDKLIDFNLAQNYTLRPFSTKAFPTTTKSEKIIKKAAHIGLIIPKAAKGIATKL